MNEKIVVIGSHSFLGSHFIHHALSQGSNVLALSHAPKKSIPFRPYHWKTGSAHKLSSKQLDANDHPDKAINLINDYQPDYIVNCAEDALVKVHHGFKNLSSKSPSIIIPAVHIYGPGQQVHELIPRIILSILLEKKIPLYNGGHALRSLMHIDDLVVGIAKTAYQGTPGETYHFSTGHSISIRDLIALICKRMNVAFEDAVTIVDDDFNKKATPFSNHPTNHRTLDWQPTIELEQGIDSVIDWAQEWLPALKNHLVDVEE